MNPTLQNSRILVLGLGDSGMSMLRYLKRQGAQVSVADSREAPPNATRLQAEFPEIRLTCRAFP